MANIKGGARVLDSMGSFMKNALGLGHHADGTFESLEARQMLAADLPQGSMWLQWGRGSVAAIAGSYVISFDQQQTTDSAALLAREAATRLGVNIVSVQAIARGWDAVLTTDQVVTKDMAARAMGAMSGVSSIEPNQVFTETRVPNDPQFSQQYWLQNTGQFIQGVQGVAGADMHLAEAWDTSIGSRSVVAGVIDTGVDLQHPDLIPNLWTNPGEIAGNGIDDDGNGYVDDVHGFDFGEFDGNPDDAAGHGTAVAGVIGAAGNNGTGVSGVNWNVSIMALKIADAFGRLSTAAIIGAHDYATMMRQRGTNLVVTNNSYGAFAPAFYQDQAQGFIAEKQAIQRWIDAGGIFVAAAGNNGANNDATYTSFPASYNLPGIISVAATNNTDGLANFSNYGVQNVDLAAPGVNTLTTANGGGYQYISGTSFSSPAVAGVVALIKSIKPNASAVEIKQALIDSSDPLPALQGKVRSGGRVNAARAIQFITRAGPSVSSFEPGPVTGQTISGTSTPVSTITVHLSKDISAASVNAGQATLAYAGADGLFGTGDDATVLIGSAARDVTDARKVVITLNLASFGGRLPVGNFRLTLLPTFLTDLDGNQLNGTATGGTSEVYNFRVVANAGDNEQNDTLVAATRVTFNANGDASYSGVVLGNGNAGTRDVDIYRIDLARGGLISAQIFAKRLASGSTFDSYLRLFDANGNQLTANDQAFGDDAAFDYFVQTGGTYYIGVSGFGNETYDPTVEASGNPNQSRGIYNIQMSVRLAQDDVVTVPFYSSSPTPAPGTDIFRTSDAPAGPTTNIPPNQPSQTQGITNSFINITDTRQIIDVNVKVRLNHQYDGDLTISVIAPNGTEVILANRRGASGQNFTNTVFDDEATTAIAAGAAPFTGSFRPDQSLGGFDGLNANGRWTLKIVDNATGNVGQVFNWALEFTFQNDIFGPYESNDTLTTANNLATINGTGTAQRVAFLGDGGFGSFDRDVFRFSADAGTSLTASVTPAGQFNSVIRLFDSNGTQILIANPADRNSALIDGYVFANAGIYYVAVSEASNTAYNPLLVGDSSGVAAATTGSYTLDVRVAAGVSDGAGTALGSHVAFGLNTDGTFGANSPAGNAIGLVFNGVDFLAPAQSVPQVVFSGVGSGLNFSNAGGSGSNDVPFAITDMSDASNFLMTAKATFKGLRMERSFSLGANDNFIAIDVYLTNTTAAAIGNLAWAEAFNPNPGLALGESSRLTQNDITTNGKMATAKYVNNEYAQGLTVGFAAPDSDTRVHANVLSANVAFRDAGQVLGLPTNDPNGIASDAQLALIYDLGTLGAGQTTSMRYFIFFGTTPSNVDALYQQVNDGTGAGHLAASANAPAAELLSDGTTTAPLLPYKAYYPEGFFGDQIFTFVPISNPNDQAARVFAIARYETGQRDSVIGELTIPANSRSGFTIVDPQLYAQGGTLVRPGSSYAIEIRSDLPVSATFSHYDLNLLNGIKAAVGESFTSHTSSSWSFASVQRTSGNSDFLVFYNPTSTYGKVTASFYSTQGGAPFTAIRTVDGYRRGGWAVNDITLDERYTFTANFTLPTDYTVTVSNSNQGLSTINGSVVAQGTVLPAGTVIQRNSVLAIGNPLPYGNYGVSLSADIQIVASLSHYSSADRVAEGIIGEAASAATTGFVGEGQYGLNATKETISILNTGAAPAQVTLSFLYDNGSAYRTAVTVGARSNATVDVASLPNFTTGHPYGIYFESTAPVTVNAFTEAFGQAFATASAQTAYTYWGFGEGFRPGDQNTAHPGVKEYLRLYNPSTTDVVVEINVSYDGIPGTETFRRTLPARRVTEFNMDDFITGSRRLTDQWYGTTVKAATPIVAYMAHLDRAFPGGFGTLGTTLGRTSSVT